MNSNIIKITLWCIFIFYLSSILFFKRYQENILPGAGDQSGYYAYLPSVFIYHDPGKFDKTNAAARKYRQGDDTSRIYSGIIYPVNETGRKVNKYTCGVAIMNVPFFLAAHFFAKLFSYPADGFSIPYSLIIHLAAMVYILLGLWLLSKILKQYFNDRMTALLVAVLALATNLYYFGTYNSPMAHGYLFFLYCLLIYATVKWYEHFRIFHAALIGLSCGLITVIRPDELICIFIPLFYNVKRWNDFKARIAVFRRKIFIILIAVLFFVFGVLPQVLYWKFTTGHFLFYSYGNESFNFRHPHIFDGLVGWKNGWLSYTPVMVLAVTGIIFLFRKGEFLVPVLLILPLHVYIIYSWWCWNYINGFGSRPMVELYPLLAFPMGFTFQFIFRRKILAGIFIPLLIFFSFQNIFNTYQHKLGIMWSEDANFAYYRTVFGKTKQDQRSLATYDLGIYQPQNLHFIKTILINHFEDSVDQHYSRKSRQGRFSFAVNQPEQYAYVSTIDISAAKLQKDDWIKVSFYAMKEDYPNGIYNMITFVSETINKQGKSRWYYVRIDNKLNEDNFSLWWGQTQKWYPVSYFFKPWQDYSDLNKLNLFIYNGCKCNEVHIDDLTVEVWK